MNGYGATEVCAVASLNYYGQFSGSFGIPISRNTISVFDPDSEKELSHDEIGEICILTPYRMLVYLNNPEATVKVIKRHKDGNEWFHTGDLGFMNEKGAVYITGRIKRIILTEKDGMVSKIFPDRVEKTLEAHEAVEVACVVKSSADNEPEVKLAAYVVLKEKYRSDGARIEKELRDLCKSELLEYSLPSKYEFIDAMPLTAVGKIDFRALEKLAGQGE